MRVKSLWVLVIILLVVCWAELGQTQTQSKSFQIPPEIQAIINKAQNRQPLSKDEQKKMLEWSESMKQGGSEAMKAQKTSAAKKCPDRKQIENLPTRAPELKEYTRFLTALSGTYGSRNAAMKGQIEGAIGRVQTTGAGADLGGILTMSGAGDAAVYAIVQSALLNPLDFLAANNLGVVLKGIGDYKNALTALLWANKLKPGATLAQINLGWFWYDLGDCERAAGYFKQAALKAPDAPGPKLGLGLIARCQGDDLTAMRLLREASLKRFSGVGAIAYRQARQAVQDAGKDQAVSKPVSGEKSGSEGLNLPEQPVIESKVVMANMGPVIKRDQDALTRRILALDKEIRQQVGIVIQQSEKAAQDPGNSVVFSRDFSKELFMLEDITLLLFGAQGGVYQQSLRESTEHLKAISTYVKDKEQALKEIINEMQRLGEREDGLVKERRACGGNNPCEKAVDVKKRQLEYEKEQSRFKLCEYEKRFADYSYSQSYKAWKVRHDAVKTTAMDYYAFTTPIIKKVYPPSLNALLNMQRELRILVDYKVVLDHASGLPGEANRIRKMKCVEPEPPGPPAPEGGEPQVEKTKEPCPFDKPLKLKIIVVSISLDCEKVKLEGGEGILVSCERNFKHHETTFGIGVGAGYEGPGVGAGAKVMVEVTVSDNNVVKDVAFGSEVKVSAGRAEATLSGRVSMESGPAINFDPGVNSGVGAGGLEIDLL